jgi:2-deoxy-D-gluconate 3-dehydrogenase
LSSKPSPRFDVRDRVVILTGGAGLLGAEYALALADAGARPVIADVNLNRARRVAARLSGALAVRVDVTDPASVRRMVSRVLRECGRIDALVNNAALDPKFDPTNAPRHAISFEDFPLDLWNHGLAVDLTGMFLCAQAVAPSMLRQGKGVIVNVSSTYGLVGPDQRLYESGAYKPVVYSVTKSAVLGFTRYLAAYWAGKGLRVNSLTPGGVYNGHDDEFVRRYSSRTPLGRMADKSEYCGALLFLLSDASSYMTGANLVVDGGWTAW